MHSESSAAQQAEQIPRIAPGWDPSTLRMSPAEGFLLSRIDGLTPWRLLRDMGSIPPEEVDRTLERWVLDGLLMLDGDATDLHRAEGGSAERTLPGLQIDPNVDLSPDFQQEILDFEASIEERSYFEILGVEQDAAPRTIKKAYFALSKRFHPDRYFRREIGGFAERLERIFKAVMEAYELLSDPTTRAEIEKGFAVGSPEAERDESEPPRIEGEAYALPSRMENLRKLRDRVRPPQALLAERRVRAGQFFEAATRAMHMQRWLEAAASARLAIAFDPWNHAYKTGFVEIQAHVNRERAVELLGEARDAAARGEAMALLEEAIHYRPLDPVANARAADLALSLGDLDKAMEYADAAAEIDPEQAAHHLLRARVLRRKQDPRGARGAIDQAARLAPKDEEVIAERRLQASVARG